jgi:hypothetical protein
VVRALAAHPALLALDKTFIEGQPRGSPRAVSDRLTPTIVRRSVPLVVGCVLVSSCYEARFPAISFSVLGSYEYTFSRFPADDAYVVRTTPSEPSPASIERLTTKVALRVLDPGGRLRCEAAGSPAGKGGKAAHRQLLGRRHRSLAHGVYVTPVANM